MKILLDNIQYISWEDHVNYVYEFSKSLFEEKRKLEIGVENLKDEVEELKTQLRSVMDLRMRQLEEIDNGL